LLNSILKSGEEYSKLLIVYSINFLNFTLAKNYSEYYFDFSILENTHPEIQLIENLKIVIIELPQLRKKFEELETILDYWLYSIRSKGLKEEEMKSIMKKSKGLNKAKKEVKFISLNQENRKLMAARLLAEIKSGNIKSLRIRKLGGG
jgi:predicted transposase/invertase (TIGR01784 family)